MALLALLIAIWLAIIALRRRAQTVPGWQPLAWLAGGGAVLALVLLLIDLESQKLAVRLIAPLGLAWLGLYALSLDLLRQRRWGPGGAAAACWLLLTLGGNAWLATWLLGTLERSLPPPVGGPYDAVVVLGGGTGLAPDGEPQLDDAGDRLRVGHALWRERTAPLLVATGTGLFDSACPRDLSEEAARLWQGWGVPRTDMLLLPGPLNTRQEIQRLAEEARHRGWRRVALVTSGWHLPRALALARRHGLPADPFPADRRGRPPAASPVFLVPGGGALHDTQLWLTEVIGRAVGR